MTAKEVDAFLTEWHAGHLKDGLFLPKAGGGAMPSYVFDQAGRRLRRFALRDVQEQASKLQLRSPFVRIWDVVSIMEQLQPPARSMESAGTPIPFAHQTVVINTRTSWCGWVDMTYSKCGVVWYVVPHPIHKSKFMAFPCQCEGTGHLSAADEQRAAELAAQWKTLRDEGRLANVGGVDELVEMMFGVAAESDKGNPFL